MNYSIKLLDIDAWLTSAKHFSDYNYTHYWNYSQLAAERIRAKSEHIAVIDEQGVVIALSNVRIKKLPFGLGGIAYISGGPMVDRKGLQFEEALLSSLNAIQNEYVKKRGLVLRISQRHKYSLYRTKETSIYQSSGFLEYGKTNATMLIDLSLELEVLRKKFHQKWRNILNKSERQNIEIIAGNDLRLFSDFKGLFSELIARKNIEVDMDERFFMNIQSQSPEQEKFHLAIAYFDNSPIAGHLSSMSGDTSVYLLGATNDIGRKLGASYLLQWHVISESKNRGCQWYDLGGVDKEENPHVYMFKERMGGGETEIGVIFQVYAGLKGSITLWLEKTYKLIKNH